MLLNKGFKYLKRYCCALSFLFLVQALGVAWSADDYEMAKKAVREGNPAEAYFLMRPLAEDDEEEAAYFLGWMYHEGHGLIADDKKAEEWWLLAAEEGHIESIMALGLLYQQGGINLEADTGKAVDFYLLAAAEEEEDARLNIAALLLRDDMPATRKIRKILRNDPEILGEMTEIVTEYASAREFPRTSAKSVATLVKGAELVKIARKKDWFYVGLPAKRKLAWVHESALPLDPAR